MLLRGGNQKLFFDYFMAQNLVRGKRQVFINAKFFAPKNNFAPKESSKFVMTKRLCM